MCFTPITKGNDEFRRAYSSLNDCNIVTATSMRDTTIKDENLQKQLSDYPTVPQAQFLPVFTHLSAASH